MKTENSSSDGKQLITNAAIIICSTAARTELASANAPKCTEQSNVRQKNKRSPAPDISSSI